MSAAESAKEPMVPGAPPAPPGTDPAASRVPAWELVESGRYRPRRIRGSFPGRELG
jgi:hypothetical protein